MGTRSLHKKAAEPLPQIFGPCLLWPNSWMDQGGTWHRGRPQPRQLCVRRGPRPSSPKGGGAPIPNFRPISIVDKQLCVRLGPSFPRPKKGAEPLIFGPFLLWPNGCMYQNTTWYRGRAHPRRHGVRCGPSSPSPKGTQPRIFGRSPLWPNGGWTKMPLGMEVGFGPGDFVFNGDPAPPEKETQPPPNF